MPHITQGQAAAIGRLPTISAKPIHRLRPQPPPIISVPGIGCLSTDHRLLIADH
jgi:hypothetical protein